MSRRASNGPANWCAASRPLRRSGLIADLVGTGVASQQSVPAAFAVLEVAEGDPWQAAVISANLGGDTDTIGAIAAGMAGACAGMAQPAAGAHRRTAGHRSRRGAGACRRPGRGAIRPIRRQGGSMTPPCPCRQRRGRLCLPHRRPAAARRRKDRRELRPRRRRRLQHDGRGAPHRHAGRVRRPARHRAERRFPARSVCRRRASRRWRRASWSMDTGNCVVLVSADAERTFVSWPGAEGSLARRDLCTGRAHGRATGCSPLAIR